MSPRFDETKAAQTAALILRLRGAPMHYLKLIKLLYLIDRAALQRWGFPVTTDHYASMDNGPVVSNILNLITEEQRSKAVWSTYISPPLGEFEVALRNEDFPIDRLSAAEEKLIREIYEQFGYMNRWDLVDYVHHLPEYQDPKGSSIPIHIREILQAGGEDDNEIRAILRELRAMNAADEVLMSAPK